MEALLNDFGRVFLLERMMACAITICVCYTTYTDIHFRHIPHWASGGLLAVGLREGMVLRLAIYAGDRAEEYRCDT